MPTEITPKKWTAHAQASANNYIILSENNWVAAIQFNGEFMDARQAEYARAMAAAPELLAVVHSAREFFESYSVGAMSRNNAEAMADEVLSEVRSVLAKIGGAA